jgi:hypothetical protein
LDLVHGDNPHGDDKHWDSHGDVPSHADGNHFDIFPHMPGIKDPAIAQLFGLVLTALNDFDRDISDREGRMADHVRGVGAELARAVHTLGQTVQKLTDRLDKIDRGGPGTPGRHADRG